MNRLWLNTLIDGLAFVSAVLMTVTGFVLRFVLPPGSGGLEGMGPGHGAMRRQVTLLWGYTRHEWGNVHYWLALGLLAVLSLHLLLHARWILCRIQGQPTEKSGLRLAVGVAALVLLIAFALAPFLSSTQRIERGEILQQRATENGGH